MKIVHIISSLHIGGAQQALYKLVTNLDYSLKDQMVISLTDDGIIGKKIENLGIHVEYLNMRRGTLKLGKLIYLIRCILKFKPSIIQTWMYHADLIGSLVSIFVRDSNLIWNIRQTDIDKKWMKKRSILIAKICSFLSYFFPKKIICCSKSSYESHVIFGYSENRMVMIPNGFDLNNFKPNKVDKESNRCELNILKDEFVIGLVARFHPVKDHKTFIESISLVIKNKQNIKVIMCGEGINYKNDTLFKMIKSFNLEKTINLLDKQSDLPKIYSTMNILVSSSISEGFPNVIGEAMACGVPCVATAVGESSFIIGKTGLVVPSQDSKLLAKALTEMIEYGTKKRLLLGDLARDRIKKYFSLDTVTIEYKKLYDSLEKV